jgi:hypothetical protein
MGRDRRRPCRVRPDAPKHLRLAELRTVPLAGSTSALFEIICRESRSLILPVSRSPFRVTCRAALSVPEGHSSLSDLPLEHIHKAPVRGSTASDFGQNFDESLGRERESNPTSGGVAREKCIGLSRSTTKPDRCCSGGSRERNTVAKASIRGHREILYGSLFGSFKGTHQGRFKYHAGRAGA